MDSLKRKIFFCLIAGLWYVAQTALMSLAPPFYPSEAKTKGATPSQYGFVFGISNLAACITSPFVGKIGAWLGIRFLFKTTTVALSIVGTAFGFLEFISNIDLFLILSYFFRVIIGVTNNASWACMNSILISIFPSHSARVLSYGEVLTGLGYMIGPAMGSILYDKRGFIMPFLSTGVIAIILSICLIFIIPEEKCEIEQLTETNNDIDKTKNLSLSSIFSTPRILFPFIDNMICFMGTGMMEAMLEPYAKEKVMFSQEQVGLTFMIYGLTYGIGSPMAGYFCDKIKNTSFVSLSGNIVLMIAFAFLAPSHFIHINPSKCLIQVMIAMAGLGYVLVMVSSFIRARNETLKQGYSDSIKTNLMISSVWSSSFYLGNFMGPTIGGFFVDELGFPWTTALFSFLYCVTMCINLVDIFM